MLYPICELTHFMNWAKILSEEIWYTVSSETTVKVQCDLAEGT
jgi:hypothetical protein